MPEIIQGEQSFVEPQVEGSIDLAANVEMPSAGGEKEAVVERVAAEKDAAYQNILSKIGTQAVGGDDTQLAADAAGAAAKTDAASQVQHLVELALTKDVAYAVKVARHLEDNYVLDTFHDRLLAEDLHAALLAKGLLKEI